MERSKFFFSWLTLYLTRPSQQVTTEFDGGVAVTWLRHVIFFLGAEKSSDDMICLAIFFRTL